MEPVLQNARLIKRAYWLIKLRWIAVASVVGSTYFCSNILAITLQDFALYSIAILLALYNMIVLLLLNHFTKNNHDVPRPAVKRIINFQVSADLLLLTVLLHFSGGIENPLAFYFMFHMIIASILLSVRESYLQATLAVSLFGLLVLLEYLRLIPHHCLKGFVVHCLYRDSLYVFGTFFVFTTALYLAVYMASYIAVRLRQAEQSYREANILLREKDRIKNEYVLRVTHDIKGHLAAIQSCLDVVSQKLIGPLNQQQQDFVSSADVRTRKLTSFIKALLRLTQIRLNNNLQMEMFSLKNTITEALNTARVEAQDKSIVLKSKINLMEDKIFGDPLSIEEVIINLLLNAIKYTEKNGEVEINAVNDEGCVLIEIIDTGIGIPEEELPKIFDEFYRATNAKKVEKDGTGLGLSIAKQIVERHNGKIWVNSQKGVGTKFSFNLPQDKL